MKRFTPKEWEAIDNAVQGGHVDLPSKTEGLNEGIIAMGWTCVAMDAPSRQAVAYDAKADRYLYVQWLFSYYASDATEYFREEWRRRAQAIDSLRVRTGNVKRAMMLVSKTLGDERLHYVARLFAQYRWHEAEVELRNMIERHMVPERSRYELLLEKVLELRWDVDGEIEDDGCTAAQVAIELGLLEVYATVWCD